MCRGWKIFIPVPLIYSVCGLCRLGKADGTTSYPHDKAVLLPVANARTDRAVLDRRSAVCCGWAAMLPAFLRGDVSHLLQADASCEQAIGS